MISTNTNMRVRAANAAAGNNNSTALQKAIKDMGLRSTGCNGVYCEIHNPNMPKGNYTQQRHYVWNETTQKMEELPGIYHISANGTDTNGSPIQNASLQAILQGYNFTETDGEFEKDGKNYTYNAATNQFTEVGTTVGTGSWNTKAIEDEGIDLNKYGKYFIGVYTNWYRFNADSIKADFQGKNIQNLADLKAAIDELENKTSETEERKVEEETQTDEQKLIQNAFAYDGTDTLKDSKNLQGNYIIDKPLYYTFDIPKTGEPNSTISGTGSYGTGRTDDYVATYDSEGKLVKIETTSAKYGDKTITYEYSSDGEFTETSYEKDAEVVIETTYNKDGSIKNHKEYSSFENYKDGYASITRDYTYSVNEQGQPVQTMTNSAGITVITTRNDDGTYTKIVTDENGVVRKEVANKRTQTYSDGTYSIEEEDSEGNYIRGTHYNADGSVIHSTEIEYYSDGSSKRTAKNKDGLPTQILNYDKDGKTTLEQLFNEDGSLKSTTEFKYEDDCTITITKNQNGDIVSSQKIDNNDRYRYQILYNPDGSIKEKTLYEYHDDGSLTVTSSDKDENVFNVSEYGKDGRLKSNSYKDITSDEVENSRIYYNGNSVGLELVSDGNGKLKGIRTWDSNTHEPSYIQVDDSTLENLANKLNDIDKERDELNQQFYNIPVPTPPQKANYMKDGVLDEEAFDDAIREYNAAKEEYDNKISEHNHKIAELQKEANKITKDKDTIEFFTKTTNIEKDINKLRENGDTETADMLQKELDELINNIFKMTEDYHNTLDYMEQAYVEACDMKVPTPPSKLDSEYCHVSYVGRSSDGNDIRLRLNDDGTVSAYVTNKGGVTNYGAQRVVLTSDNNGEFKITVGGKTAMSLNEAKIKFEGNADFQRALNGLKQTFPENWSNNFSVLVGQNGVDNYTFSFALTDDILDGDLMTNVYEYNWSATNETVFDLKASDILYDEKGNIQKAYINDENVSFDKEYEIDEEAYNNAMREYNEAKTEYDKQQTELNLKIREAQQKAKQLELEINHDKNISNIVSDYTSKLNELQTQVNNTSDSDLKNELTKAYEELKEQFEKSLELHKNINNEYSKSINMEVPTMPDKYSFTVNGEFDEYAYDKAMAEYKDAKAEYDKKQKEIADKINAYAQEINQIVLKDIAIDNTCRLVQAYSDKLDEIKNSIETATDSDTKSKLENEYAKVKELFNDAVKASQYADEAFISAQTGAPIPPRSLDFAVKQENGDYLFDEEAYDNAMAQYQKDIAVYEEKIKIAEEKAKEYNTILDNINNEAGIVFNKGSQLDLVNEQNKFQQELAERNFQIWQLSIQKNEVLDAKVELEVPIPPSKLDKQFIHESYVGTSGNNNIRIMVNDDGSVTAYQTINNAPVVSNIGSQRVVYDMNGITVGGKSVVSLNDAEKEYGNSADFKNALRGLKHSFPDNWQDFTVLVSTNRQGEISFSFAKTDDIYDQDELASIYEVTTGRYDENIGDIHPSNIIYDENGNIKSVNMNGLNINLEKDSAFDEDGYEAAMQRYNDAKAEYDKALKELNDKLEIYERQEKLLEENRNSLIDITNQIQSYSDKLQDIQKQISEVTDSSKKAELKEIYNKIEEIVNKNIENTKRIIELQAEMRYAEEPVKPEKSDFIENGELDRNAYSRALRQYRSDRAAYNSQMNDWQSELNSLTKLQTDYEKEINDLYNSIN